jgi:dihydrofolate reductase
MRQLVVFAYVSVDGVAESPERFFAAWDDVVDKAGDELIAPQDAVILGRRSYDEWADYWPTSEIEPFATFINGVTKHVATSTPLDRDWPNASVIDGDLIAFVRELKARPGGDIGVHASISVAQALLAAGVVDVLRLATAPAVIGSGRRLLDGLPALRLELLRGLTTPSGYVVADYRVAAD